MVNDILQSNDTVYLVAHKPIQLYAGLDNGHQYVTVVRHNLSVVEVAREDIGQLLLKRCGCCDSVYFCFRMASEEEVNLWRSPQE